MRSKASIPKASGTRLETSKALLLPVAFMIALAGMAFLVPIRQNPTVTRTFLGTAVLLGAWIAAMKFDVLRRNRALTAHLPFSWRERELPS